jgi:hypothetical protein
MKTLALLALVVLTGCDADVLGTARADAQVPNTGPRAISATVATAPTDAGALAGRSLGGSSIATMRLLASSDGRAALARVVSCALPPGASLTTIDRDGTPFSFAGSLGLAPGWVQRPATASERHRVDTCVRALRQIET